MKTSRYIKCQSQLERVDTAFRGDQSKPYGRICCEISIVGRLGGGGDEEGVEGSKHENHPKSTVSGSRMDLLVDFLANF